MPVILTFILSRLINKKHAHRDVKVQDSSTANTKSTSEFTVSDGQQLGMAISEATKGVAFFAVKQQSEETNTND